MCADLAENLTFCRNFLLQIYAGKYIVKDVLKKPPICGVITAKSYLMSLRKPLKKPSICGVITALKTSLSTLQR